MNFKKRVNGSWTDTPHYIHKTDTDTITTLPAVLYPTGTTATVGLKGNTLQSSIPSPTSPVIPQGTGERTGNWFDKSTNIVAYYLAQTTGVYTATSSTSRSALVPCKPSTTYTIHVPTNRTLRIVEFDHYPQAGDAGSNYTSQETGSYIDKDVTVTTTATAKYLCVFCYNSVQEATQYTESEYFAQVMIIEGSTPTSTYIPYGYKIPISSAGLTTPVYLGEVETTRKIGKYVCTGEESIGYTTISGNSRFTIDSAFQTADYRIGICSHYKYEFVNANNTVYHTSTNTSRTIFILDNNYTTATDFKAYLAQQYANGTPVTVWYVLATEETGIVNEPLMRIGDYADTLSNVTIPVTAGGDTISVSTTLQPSEVTVNYKGWHPVADVHERENGAWT